MTKSALTTLAVTSTLVLGGMVLTAPAYAVVYDFTFDNVINGGGTVDGMLTLPSSADGTYSASSVIVTSNTAGFGLGQYLGTARSNSFTISGGNITNANFIVFGIDNSSPDVVCCSLQLNNNFLTGTLEGGLADLSALVRNEPADVLTFTMAPTSATPLPAGLPLFATGLGALGLLGWFRKRKVRASLLGAA
jgi:hypothetical protein